MFCETKAVEFEKASSERKGTAQLVLEIEHVFYVESAVVLAYYFDIEDRSLRFWGMIDERTPEGDL